MKAAVFCALIFLMTLAVQADTHRVSLPCRGGAVETYYLDLSAFSGKAADFRLVDDRGSPVPFSFDFKLALPRPNGLYRRPADGFYSKESAPAVEDRFRLPGYFTFRTRPGITNCVLSFDVGERGEWPKSDPALRPWWINLLANVVAFRENTGTIFRPTYLPQLAKTAGRSVNVWLRTDTSGTGRFLCQLNVPNARPSPPETTHFYFSGEPGVWDHLGEGVAKTGDWTLPAKIGHLMPLGMSSFSVRDMAVQSAPGLRLEGAVPQTDLAYVGDRLRFSVPQAAAEASFACVCDELAAERVYMPRARLTVRARLVSDGGRILKECVGELDLAGVSSGTYRLESVLTDGVQDLSPRVFRLVVRPSPWN